MSAGSETRVKIFVRDLVLDAVLGIHPHEKRAPQPIRINVELEAVIPGPIGDAYENTVCYHEAVKHIEAIVAAGHINLAETLAERIAGAMLADRRVEVARIRIEKLAAVPRTASVGVEIERRRSDLS